jgi:hypothetical protein
MVSTPCPTRETAKRTEGTVFEKTYIASRAMRVWVVGAILG